MKILYSNYVNEESILRKFNFEKFSQEKHNVVLHLDTFHNRKEKFVKDINEKHYLFDIEMPNRWINNDTRQQCFDNENLYDKIFTICPYTVKQRNKFLNKNLYEYVFLPFPKEYIPNIFEKKFDFTYIGNGDHAYYYLDKINFKNYNYAVCGSKYQNAGWANFSQKIKITSESKISLVHNEYILSDIALNELKTLDNMDNYFIIKNNKLTQHKERVMTAAFAKSIILCKKDEFNIIEDIFDENKEFLYFDENNINDILDEVLNNYEKYYYLSENAFNKATKIYTVDNFFDKYINQG